MSKTRVVLNYKGFNEFRKSSEMEALVQELADGIQSRVGQGYASDTKQMSTRVIASVYTDTFDAMQHELETNDLLKAVY